MQHSLRSARFAGLGLAALLVAACSGPAEQGTSDAGSQQDAGQDAGNQQDAGQDAGTSTGMYPAAFPPPQVVNSGGATLKTPVIVPVFFSNDDAATVSQIADFDQRLVASSFWTTTAEYGIGAATAAPPVNLAEKAPTTIDDATNNSPLAQWLIQKFGAKELPAPTANSLYVLYYPAGTTVTQGSDKSCDVFLGYHSEVTLPDNTHVAYAVVPRCPAANGFSVLDFVTSTASHEIIEAATNPYPENDPAWDHVDDASVYWDDAMGGSEVADMCQNDPEAYLQFDDLQYLVQRIWSNKAALAGQEPCVPEFDQEVYFNAIPELTEDVSYTDFYGDTTTLKGVNVPVGTSKTIDLDLFSVAPLSGPISIDVQDYNTFNGTGSATIAFSLDKKTANAGEKVKLTITPKSAGQGSSDVFYIMTTVGEDSHLWVGAITE